MSRYLISFDDGSMTFPGEDFPAVAEASHRVVQEAKDAGVWIFGAGVERQQESEEPSTEERDPLGRAPLSRKGSGSDTTR